MERIIRMRKEVPEIGWGDFSILGGDDPAVLAIRYDWRNNDVIIVHNLGDSPTEFVLETGLGEEADLLVNLLSQDHSQAFASGRHKLLLEAYAYRWFRVGGLDYLLRRGDSA